MRSSNKRWRVEARTAAGWNVRRNLTFEQMTAAVQGALKDPLVHEYRVIEEVTTREPG